MAKQTAKDKEAVQANDAVDVQQIERDIMNYSRAPFRAELARILKCKPDEESLRAFAKKTPDRWSQATAIFGRLAGYSDKIEVDGSLAIKMNQISDSQLMQLLEKLRNELKEEIRREMESEKK